MTPERLLEFEARWPRQTPAKDHAVRRELGLSPARFYQLLHRAARSPEGIRADPITARTVRDLLAARSSMRERRLHAT